MRLTSDSKCGGPQPLPCRIQRQLITHCSSSTLGYMRCMYCIPYMENNHFSIYPNAKNMSSVRAFVAELFSAILKIKPQPKIRSILVFSIVI